MRFAVYASRVQMRLVWMVMLGVVAALPGRAEPAAVRLMECTFKLFNQDSTATCFLVHDEDDAERVFLVTAAHVLEAAGGPEAVLVLREKQEDGTFVRKDSKLQIRSEGKDLWTKHSDEDVAALRLKLQDGSRPPSLSTSQLAREADLLAEEVTLCSRVWMLGYPARLEANGAGFPVARNASIASYPLTPVQPHRTFMADGSTFAGDSGGPVFTVRRMGEAAGEPLVLGMVVAQYRNDEKVKMLHEERLLRHRLSLAKVLQAEFILQTIALVK